MKQILNTLIVIIPLLLLFPFTAMRAQTSSEQGVTLEEINKLNTNRKLIADKVTTKVETAAIDSVQLQYELDEEDEMTPADELYEGIWNDQFVKIYSGVTIPDTFRIDLSSFVMPV